jgi:hypothetical protein
MVLAGRQMAVSNRPAQRHSAAMSWATVIIFLLGIANFAINRAVFDRGHPLFARLPQASQTLGQRAALASEFAVLFFALLLSVEGWPGYAWAYAVYTAVNAGAAWLILTRRV